MAATAPLYRDDAYAKTCEAQVVAVTPEGGVVLDRTVFYPQGGEQPGDRGLIRSQDGREIAIKNTLHGADRSQILHLVEGDPPRPNERVSLALDWPLRLKRMRIHT